MKKLWIGISTAALVMGIGTAGAYAASDNNDVFKQMLPHAKQMHPNLTEKQLKEMHNNCHNSNGNGSEMQGMMNNKQMRIYN